MTFAQQLKQQGRQESRYEIAKSLLAEGLPLDLVKKVTLRFLTWIYLN